MAAYRLIAAIVVLLAAGPAYAQYPYPTTTLTNPVVSTPTPPSGNIPKFGAPTGNSTVSIIDSAISTAAVAQILGSACPPHNYVTGVAASGSPTCHQPATTDLSDISSLLLGLAPLAQILGSACPPHNYVTGIAMSGSPTCRQPATTDLSDSLTTPPPTIGGIFTTPTARPTVPILGLAQIQSIPLGAHAAAQEWLVFKNSNGVLRYVPAY